MHSKAVFFTLLVVSCVCIVSLGCSRKHGSTGAVPPLDPEDTKELVKQMGAGKGVKSFGVDSRVAIAQRLRDLGPAVKEYGAVEALQKASKDKDPKVAEAAKEALAKIQAQ